MDRQIDPRPAGTSGIPANRLVWETLEASGFFYQNQSLGIDRGGNLYFLGLRGSGSTIFAYASKWVQPVAGIPTLLTGQTNHAIEGQSVYGPGAGRLSASHELFTLPLTFGFDEGSFTDTVLFGEWGGRLAFNSSGSLYMGVKAEVSGGDTDVHFPLEAKFQIPDQNTLLIGQPVVVNTGWSINEPACRMTTRGEPSFNAGLTYDIYDHLYGLAQLEIASEFLLNTEFVNTTIDSPASGGPDYIPGLNVIDMIEARTGQDLHDWVEIGKNGFFLKARLPQLFAQATLQPSSSTVTRTFSSSAQSRFFQGGVNITEAILAAIVGGVQEHNPNAPEELNLVTSKPSISLGNSDFRLTLEARIAQLIARCDLAVTQGLTATVTPRVRCTLSDGSVRDINLGGPNGDPNGGQFTFSLPSSTRMDVTPEVYLRIQFTNNTSLQLIPGVDYEALAFGARATASGVTLFDYDQCFGCGTEEITVADIPIYSNTWSFDTPRQKITPFTVTGSPNQEPRIIGASRFKMPMLIYRQTAPSRSQFNTLVNASTAMLIYGDRFTPQMSVQFMHMGRTESVPCTYINPSTARITIPNRFRLIPGTGRLRVSTAGGVSNVIDLPVTLPIPRVSTVNPNLWAADPSLADIPVQPIDAFSSVGSDTFIARRDYYVKLRDTLWNSTTASVGAAAYFPDFNFNSMPPFPAVLMDGVPLPRFVQPVDSGLHNVRLTETDYNRPRLAAVQLINPGPGGGKSAPVVLNISAPVPCVSFVEPPEILPTAEPLKITIHGPPNVPYVPNYEEPKFGNFTKASVVRLDGIALATDFVNSSTLTAIIPAHFLETIANHSITVNTPANGTVYFEQLFTGEQDPQIDAPFFQGFLPSGGESPSLLFPVRYPEPIIEALSPESTTVNNIVFMNGLIQSQDPDGPRYNLGIAGRNFRQGTVVLFEGTPIPTTVVTGQLIHATVPADAVASVGNAVITIMNPGPDFQLSQPAVFYIDP